MIRNKLGKEGKSTNGINFARTPPRSSSYGRESRMVTSYSTLEEVNYADATRQNQAACHHGLRTISGQGLKIEPGQMTWSALEYFSRTWEFRATQSSD